MEKNRIEKQIIVTIAYEDNKKYNFYDILDTIKDRVDEAYINGWIEKYTVNIID